MIYTTKVVEVLENGDALIELPEEMLKNLDWKVGDVLDYQLKDGKVYIKNLTKEKNVSSS